ncbi:MAG: CsbD family protein [Polyangiaceae bacterium]
MNWTEIEGKWVDMKGQARSRWAKLTDDDLKFVEGHFDKLVGKVVERYGIAKEQARAEVNVWADRVGARIDQSSRAAEKKVESTNEATKGAGPR